MEVMERAKMTISHSGWTEHKSARKEQVSVLRDKWFLPNFGTRSDSWISENSENHEFVSGPRIKKQRETCQDGIMTQDQQNPKTKTRHFSCARYHLSQIVPTVGITSTQHQVRKSPIHPKKRDKQHRTASLALHYFQNIICVSYECRKMMRSHYRPGFFASQRSQAERNLWHFITNATNLWHSPISAANLRHTSIMRTPIPKLEASHIVENERHEKAFEFKMEIIALKANFMKNNYDKGELHKPREKYPFAILRARAMLNPRDLTDGMYLVNFWSEMKYLESGQNKGNKGLLREKGLAGKLIDKEKKLNIGSLLLSCAPINCGKHNIRYPFYIKGQNSSCGYPGFELNCTNNEYPVLQIPQNNYIVDQFFYNNRSVRVYNAAVLNVEIGCLPQIRNLSLDNRFSLVDDSAELVLFTNCSTNISSELLRYRVKCGEWELAMLRGDAEVGVAMEECRENVVAPVELYDGEGVDDYGELMRRGFVLNWTASDCSVCEESGGRCGFDYAAYRFICFCPGSPQIRDCSSDLIEDRFLLLAFRGPLRNIYKRFESIPLLVLLMGAQYFAPSTLIHSIVILVVHFTNQGQNLEIPPNTKASSYVENIEDGNDFFLKHYTGILAPEMIWRYGHGPRASNMDLNVRSVEQLRSLDILVRSKRRNPKIKAAEAASKGLKPYPLRMR
ncbi:hypothetical protein LguiB_031893 [Lonicera macranthoides]